MILRMADSLIAKDKFILSYAVKKMNMKPAEDSQRGRDPRAVAEGLALYADLIHFRASKSVSTSVSVTQLHLNHQLITIRRPCSPRKYIVVSVLPPNPSSITKIPLLRKHITTASILQND